MGNKFRRFFTHDDNQNNFRFNQTTTSNYVYNQSNLRNSSSSNLRNSSSSNLRNSSSSNLRNSSSSNLRNSNNSDYRYRSSSNLRNRRNPNYRENRINEILERRNPNRSEKKFNPYVIHSKEAIKSYRFECCVCYTLNRKRRKIIKCNHHLCKTCYKKIQNPKKCPLCRESM